MKAELKAASGFLCNAAVACRRRSSALRSSKKSADTEVFVAERSVRRWHAVAMSPHCPLAAQRSASQGRACPLLGALSRRAHSSVDEFDPNGCGALAGCARRLGSRAARGVCAGLELNSGPRSTVASHGSRAGGEFFPVRAHAIRPVGMTAAGHAAASQWTNGAQTTARTPPPLLRADRARASSLADSHMTGRARACQMRQPRAAHERALLVASSRLAGWRAQRAAGGEREREV